MLILSVILETFVHFQMSWGEWKKKLQPYKQREILLENYGYYPKFVALYNHLKHKSCSFNMRHIDQNIKQM